MTTGEANGSSEATSDEVSNKQLRHRFAVADEPELPLDVVELRPRVDAQRVVDARRELADVDGPLLRVAADPVGRADHLAAADAAAGQHHRVAVAPVVP